MKKAIVITTIYPATEAVKKYAKMSDYELVVVGDKKTPEPWILDNSHFLSVNDASTEQYHLHAHLPMNHYARKMLGYIFAKQRGAKFIIDTDDDNIPNDYWQFPPMDFQGTVTESDLAEINVYRWFTDQLIWPRGFPINQIHQDSSWTLTTKSQQVKVGVWQSLADEDPDVDAIYRMMHPEPVYFEPKQPIVLGKGTIAPFNTQNTCIAEPLFPLLYLPMTVTFRFTDILRGLVAQPIMWHHGFHLGFQQATVTQRRNPHDLMRDFEDEVPMYLTSKKVSTLAHKYGQNHPKIQDNLRAVYHALAMEGIVQSAELASLEAWLQDMV